MMFLLYITLTHRYTHLHMHCSLHISFSLILSSLPDMYSISFFHMWNSTSIHIYSYAKNDMKNRSQKLVFTEFSFYQVSRVHGKCFPFLDIGLAIFLDIIYLIWEIPACFCFVANDLPSSSAAAATCYITKYCGVRVAN